MNESGDSGDCGYEVETSSRTPRVRWIGAIARAGGRGCGGADADESDTLGIFRTSRLPQIAEILHAKGALLYMDGREHENALTGVTRPGDLGVDVMHLNLHKTFSGTPHGGGGPGAGSGGDEESA